MKVPFAVVNNKSELGKLCHCKSCSSVCFTKIRPEDQAAFDAITKKIGEEVDYQHLLTKYGGNKKSQRSIDKEKKRAGKK